MRNGIVVVVEGVSTGLVGAYGSNTAVTPALDRLAAHGLVLDQCFVDSLHLRKQLQSLWTGRHAAQEPNLDWSMWRQLVASGFEACLITDCEVTAKFAEQLGCPRVTLVKVDEPTEPAEDWTECGLMQVFVSAVEELSETESNRVIWIHSRGLRWPWDAPVDLRERFIDPEDPLPPSEACVPDIVITDQTDPDEIIGWGQVAAAQVAVIDQAIDILISTIESRADASDWAWMVVSPGGVPLGEHGRVGWGQPSLHGEELSCLAIVQPAIGNASGPDEAKVAPGRSDPPTQIAPSKSDPPSQVAPDATSGARPPGSRRAELCQLPDLLITFLDSLELDVSSLNCACWGRSMLRLGSFSAPYAWPAQFQAAFVEHSNDQWLRTPAWSARFFESQASELYVKPDDRWEICDVASRRLDVVERLREIAQQFQDCLRNGSRVHLPKLEDELCNLLR
ncbi:MAG: sulfatase-like hydrolase/transferase [Pirellulaceae bacterium]|nr:sulfatase-like hydrolase/transferase [Pirellulaceae bacterium]